MKTIRRSGARDLPPDVDSVRSSVTVLPRPPVRPAVGSVVKVNSYCGLQMLVRIEKVEEDDTGWRAWAAPTQSYDKELRDLGVPILPSYPLMRVFDFQVQDR